MTTHEEAQSDSIILLDDDDDELGSEPSSDEDCIIVDEDETTLEVHRPKPVTIPTLSSSNGRDEYRKYAPEYLVPFPYRFRDVSNLPEIHNPSFLKIQLRQHQRQGVRWMLAQEASRVAGGILADEMGLGKTVQILTLVCIQKQIALSNSRTRGRPLTLIVVQNISLMEQWAKEIRKCFRPNYLSSLLYHGTSRPKKASALEAYDVVITTFGTLAADSKAKTKHGVLLRVNWSRVVLDEAHNIRTKSTQRWKAASELMARYRWAVTGTPIHNKLDDLYNLYLFLQFRHQDLATKPVWNHLVSKPCGSLNEVERTRGYSRLHALFDLTALRRDSKTLIDGKPIIDLEKMIVVVLKIKLNDDEAIFYKYILERGQEAVERISHLTGQKLFKAYAAVLELLLRCRQACDHSFLVMISNHELFRENRRTCDMYTVIRDVRLQHAALVSKHEGDPESVRKEINRMLSRNRMHMCGVCYAPLGDTFIKTLCGHFFCKKCLKQAIATQAQEEAQQAAQGMAMEVEGEAAEHGKCPTCKRPLQANVLKSPKKSRNKVDISISVVKATSDLGDAADSNDGSGSEDSEVEGVERRRRDDFAIDDSDNERDEYESGEDETLGGFVVNDSDEEDLLAEASEDQEYEELDRKKPSHYHSHRRSTRAVSNNNSQSQGTSRSNSNSISNYVKKNESNLSSSNNANRARLQHVPTIRIEREEESDDGVVLLESAPLIRLGRSGLSASQQIDLSEDDSKGGRVLFDNRSARANVCDLSEDDRPIVPAFNLDSFIYLSSDSDDDDTEDEEAFERSGGEPGDDENNVDLKGDDEMALLNRRLAREMSEDRIRIEEEAAIARAGNENAGEANDTQDHLEYLFYDPKRDEARSEREKEDEEARDVFSPADGGSFTTPLKRRKPNLEGDHEFDAESGNNDNSRHDAANEVGAGPRSPLLSDQIASDVNLLDAETQSFEAKGDDEREAVEGDRSEGLGFGSFDPDYNDDAFAQDAIFNALSNVDDSDLNLPEMVDLGVLEKEEEASGQLTPWRDATEEVKVEKVKSEVKSEVKAEVKSEMKSEDNSEGLLDASDLPGADSRMINTLRNSNNNSNNNNSNSNNRNSGSDDRLSTSTSTPSPSTLMLKVNRTSSSKDNSNYSALQPKKEGSQSSPANDRKSSSEVILLDDDDEEIENLKSEAVKPSIKPESLYAYYTRSRGNSIILSAEKEKKLKLERPKSYGGEDDGDDSDEEETDTKKKAKPIRRGKPSYAASPEFPNSSKSAEFMKHLRKVMKEFPNDKCIVFSLFTMYLDLIEYKIKDDRLDYLRFDGTMSKHEKRDALELFETDERYRVLLVSTKAGGVGLNLTAANHVFMLDPWWNPAEEKQAYQRVYRIGQTKQVYIYKFLIQDSIEERIAEIQSEKQMRSDAALRDESSQLFGGAAGGKAGLSVRDLNHIFGRREGATNNNGNRGNYQGNNRNNFNGNRNIRRNS